MPETTAEEPAADAGGAADAAPTPAPELNAEEEPEVGGAHAAAAAAAPSTPPPEETGSSPEINEEAPGKEEEEEEEEAPASAAAQDENADASAAVAAAGGADDAAEATPHPPITPPAEKVASEPSQPPTKAKSTDTSKPAKTLSSSSSTVVPPITVSGADAESLPSKGDGAAESEAASPAKAKRASQYAAPMRRIKLLMNGEQKGGKPIGFVLSNKDTTMEKILERVTKSLKQWKPVQALHTLDHVKVTDPAAFVTNETYVATTGEPLKKEKTAKKKRSKRKLAPAAGAPSPSKATALPNAAQKVPPIGRANGGAAKKTKKTTTATTARKGAGYGTGSSTTRVITTTTTRTPATKKTSSKRKGKGPMTVTNPGAGGGKKAAPRVNAAAGRQKAAKADGAAGTKGGAKSNKAGGAAGTKGGAKPKRAAFRALSTEIHKTHSNEESAAAAWKDAVPGDGGMLGPRDFHEYTASKYPLLDNRSVLALAFQHTCDMQAKEVSQFAGKFRVSARYFAPLLLHAVHIGEAFSILNIKGWPDFAKICNRLGAGRLLMKLGIKAADGKRALPDADAVKLLGLNGTEAENQHALCVKCIELFTNMSTPDDWDWVVSARPGSDAQASEPGAKSELPRRALMPIVSDNLQKRDDNLSKFVSGGDDLNELWESFEHPLSTETNAKPKTLERLGQLLAENGLVASASALQFAYKMATGHEPDLKNIIERPAFQYAGLCCLLLTDLASVLGSASTTMFAEDSIISLAEFREGIKEYRVLKGEDLESACKELDTTKTGLVPYSAVCAWYVKEKMKDWTTVVVPDVRVAPTAKKDALTAKKATGGVKKKTLAAQKEAPPDKKEAPTAKKKTNPKSTPKHNGKRSGLPIPSKKPFKQKAVPKTNRKPSLTPVPMKRKTIKIVTLTKAADVGVGSLKQTREEDLAQTEVLSLVLTDARQVMQLWEEIENKVGVQLWEESGVNANGKAPLLEVANTISRTYPPLKDRLGKHQDAFVQVVNRLGAEATADDTLADELIDDARSLPATVVQLLHFCRMAQCFGLPHPDKNTEARIDAKLADDALTRLSAQHFFGGDANTNRATFDSMRSKKGGERGTVLCDEFCLWYAQKRVSTDPRVEASLAAVTKEVAEKEARASKGENVINEKPKKHWFSLFRKKVKMVQIINSFGGPSAGKTQLEEGAERYHARKLSLVTEVV